jgi:hypothetical protein
MGEIEFEKIDKMPPAAKELHRYILRVGSTPLPDTIGEKKEFSRCLIQKLADFSSEP